MQFVRVRELSEGVVPLRDRLVRELRADKQVLWLLTGGSSIAVTVAVMAELPDELTAHLTLLLSDERYGSPGHADANAQQLTAAGLQPKQAAVISILQDGLSLEETRAAYAASYAAAAHAADCIIAQFGMGSDGHIAGIKPGSPAVTSADLAAAYAWSDFQRITLTPAALRQVTAAYVYCFGDDRREQLQILQSQTIPIDEQPAQLLRQLPEAYIFNDQIDQQLSQQGEPQ